MTCKMDRALAMDRIPAGRIGRTEVLNFQADFYDCFIDRQTGDFQGRFPGSPARCTPHDGDLLNVVCNQTDLKLRGSEPYAIWAQAILPGKTASGRGRENQLTLQFFPRGHNGDVLSPAKSGQVMGQIGML